MFARPARLALAALLATAAPAGAQTLTFTNAAWGDGTTIPQSYGDIAGSVDVSYRHRGGFGNTSVIDPNAYHWRTGYNDLLSVAYSAAGSGVGEIALANLLAGQAVTLNAADVGAWSSRTLTNTVALRVYDFGWNLLYSGLGSTFGSTSHASFAPAVSATDGLYIQWSQINDTGAPIDAYNVGIDNVEFTAGPSTTTPEPATVGLMGLGLAGIAAAARRRRHA